MLSIAAVLGLILIKTSPNRMARLQCLGATEPQSGPVDCWQAVHGIYALASGGIFGSGLGASVEKWGQLPEAHTDFIFAVTGEELGLAGTLSVLALFAALGYAGIRVAGRTEDPFVRYAAGGVTTWITAQAVINIGAVLGLLPISRRPPPAVLLRRIRPAADHVRHRVADRLRARRARCAGGACDAATPLW